MIDNNPVLLGDYNQDKVVDNTDYRLLESHFLVDYLSERWNPIYDLNNDLIISFPDMVILAREMGKEADK